MIWPMILQKMKENKESTPGTINDIQKGESVSEIVSVKMMNLIVKERKKKWKSSKIER